MCPLTGYFFELYIFVFLAVAQHVLEDLVLSWPGCQVALIKFEHAPGVQGSAG